MRDRLLICLGLLLFVGMFTYPFWHAAVAGTGSAAPQVQLPTEARQCVAARDFMRSSHPKLLLEWRDHRVRSQQSEFTAANGHAYRLSLSKTCLGQCHTSKAEFCDSCHAYAAVPNPYCWDCHQSAVATKGTR